MDKFLQAVLRIVGMLCFMGVSGGGMFIICVFILMGFGGHYHGNYEYYGSYPALFLIPTGVGFLAPLVIWWCLEMKGVRGIRAFLITLLVVLVLLLVPTVFFFIMPVIFY